MSNVILFRPDPKPVTIRDKDYLDWLKTQPCCDCHGGSGQIVPCHQALDIPECGGGMAYKNNDLLALPLHHSEHDLEHRAKYEIRNKAEKIYQHLVRYKAEQHDIVFGEKVKRFLLTYTGEDDRLFHNAVSFICKIWR